MMTTLMPRRNHDLFDAFFGDPFETFFDKAPAVRTTPQYMRTDIKEHDGGYELTIDLPGFKKEDVQAELNDGVLTVTAQTSSETDDKNENGTIVRKERFSGKCSRSYFVGDEIEESDIKARFENGVLAISIPKKQPKPQLEEKKTIAIEG